MYSRCVLGCCCGPHTACLEESRMQADHSAPHVNHCTVDVEEHSRAQRSTVHVLQALQVQTRSRAITQRMERVVYMLCRSLPPGCPGLLSSDLLARRGSLYVESILLYEQVKKLVMTDACALYGVLTDSTRAGRA